MSAKTVAKVLSTVGGLAGSASAFPAVAELMSQESETIAEIRNVEKFPAP